VQSGGDRLEGALLLRRRLAVAGIQGSDVGGIAEPLGARGGCRALSQHERPALGGGGRRAGLLPVRVARSAREAVRMPVAGGRRPLLSSPRHPRRGVAGVDLRRPVRSGGVPDESRRALRLALREDKPASAIVVGRRCRMSAGEACVDAPPAGRVILGAGGAENLVRSADPSLMRRAALLRAPRPHGVHAATDEHGEGRLASVGPEDGTAGRARPAAVA